MFVVCDSSNVVQDIATEKANLSRGYLFSNYKPYEDVTITDIMIGDTYTDGNIIRDQSLRNAQAAAAENENKIAAQIRLTAVNALKAAGELPAEFED